MPQALDCTRNAVSAWWAIGNALRKDRFGMWRNTVIMERRITKDIAGGCDCEMIRALQNERV